MDESGSELVSTSKRKHQDQGTEDTSTSKRQKVDQAISDEDFMELKSVFSEWFDKRGYISNLKVLYTDLLSPAELHNASTTIHLLNCLTDHDELNSTNLTLIYDTIKVSKHFRLVKVIKQHLPSCPIPANIKDIEITSFTQHRLKLMKLGSLLTQDDVAKIDPLYNEALKKYADSWSLIIDLEMRREIFEGKMEKFISKLKKLELKTAVDSLCKGDQKDPVSVISLDPELQEHLKQGSRDASTSKRQKVEQDDITICIRDFLTKRQKQLYKNVNQMTPTIWHKYHKVDIAEVFTELILMQSKKKDKESKAKSTSIQKKGRHASLTEVLNVISTDSCKVLITGKGGMGKTTLLRYIAYQWATDDKDNAFANKLLFLINIRDIKSGEKFIDIIMKKIDVQTFTLTNKLPSNSVKDFLATHADEIVILLDGYDELEKGATDPIDLFDRTQLGKCTVLMSSRPDNIVKFHEWCDVHIKVMGFSPGNVKEYIHKYFLSIGKAEIGNSLIGKFEIEYVGYGYDDGDEDLLCSGTHKEVEDLLFSGTDEEVEDLLFSGTHKEAFQLCSSPLLLLNICNIWEKKQHLPTDLSDLFKELFCCILNQYQNRGGNKTAISQFERIPGKYTQAIQILGECIYEGLKENKLSIDKYVLLKKAKDEKVCLALELGFVYKDSPVEPYDLKEIYTTPHKLISESLAGFYLSEEIQKGSLEAEEYEVIRCNKYLQMTRVFTIGFLGANAFNLFKNWLIPVVRPSNYRSIAQCLRYVKKEYEDHVLQEMDKQMSSEMKECCEQMCQSVRKILYDKDTSNVHLFKLMSKCWHPKYNDVVKPFPVINTSNEESLRSSCRYIVHKAVVLPWVYKTKHFLREISKWEDKEIKILSAEMKNIKLTYCGVTCIRLDFNCSSSFLIHFLKHANNLSTLYIGNWLTASEFSLVINELHKAHVKLKLINLNINSCQLSSVSRRTLGHLLKVSPHLMHIDMNFCNLSGSIISEMMEECLGTNVVLKDNMLTLRGNDLSDIDSKSFAELIRVIYKKCDTFRWSDYSLKSDHLENLIDTIGENETLNWKRIDMSRIDLSSISGRTLAHLFKVSPRLIHIDMSYCKLSGNTINEMMKKCDMMNVVLKDNMLTFRGNHLSDIDSKSFPKLFKVMVKAHDTLIWRDYSFTSDHLEKLVDSKDTKETLNWKRIDMSRINLSSISGRTLAHLLKVSPRLIHIDMTHCKLSASIVNEMIEECHRINVVLKHNMLRLEGNDLSDINRKSLVELVRTIWPYYAFRWKDYSFTSDHLEKLVESIGKNETLNWNRIDMSGINLSSIIGSMLAHLLKVSPHLIHIDMRYCNISGSIINEMMQECHRMNVVLKDNMFILKGNDLSGIDGKLLAELIRVSYEPYDNFSGNYLPRLDKRHNTLEWSSYSLTYDHLEKLVESIAENETLNWERIDMSRINLSSISERTLAHLFKVSPHLIHIDMSYCSLSGSIINEMMRECHRMNVVLKDNMFIFKGNDLSGTDSKSLAELKLYYKFKKNPLKIKLKY